MSETAICEVTANVEIEFDIECGRCGSYLTAAFKEAKRHTYAVFKVDPCKTCTKEAVEDALNTQPGA